jgi:hypothetical protein
MKLIIPPVITARLITTDGTYDFYDDKWHDASNCVVYDAFIITSLNNLLHDDIYSSKTVDR